MDHAGGDLALADGDPGGAVPAEIPQIPFKEAAEFFKSRIPVTADEWDELEPKLRFRAFAVGKLNDCDAVNRVKGKLLSALEQGRSLEELWPELAEEGRGPFYWESVYRTNLQTAYNAGRRMQIDRAKPDALELLVVEDERTTGICKPLSGLGRPYDDPFWNDHWPPFHFNCRTTVRPIFKFMPEYKNMLREDVRAERTQRFTPAPGFGGSPLDTGSFWKITPNMLERAARYGIAGDIEKLARKLGLTEHADRIAAVTAWIGKAVAKAPSAVEGLRTERKLLLEIDKPDAVKPKTTLPESFYVKKDIPLKKSNLVIDKGVDVTDIEVIAEGNGIRDVDDLVNTYKKPNGSLTSPKDWLKVKGKVIVKKNGIERRIEVHWYQCKDIGKVELKEKVKE